MTGQILSTFDTYTVALRGSVLLETARRAFALAISGGQFHLDSPPAACANCGSQPNLPRLAVSD